MADRPATAPAAHLVSVRARLGGGGVLVGHTLCDAPDVFVPNVVGSDHALAVDIIQAVVGHRCVNSRETG